MKEVCMHLKLGSLWQFGAGEMQIFWIGTSFWRKINSLSAHVQHMPRSIENSFPRYFPCFTYTPLKKTLIQCATPFLFWHSSLSISIQQVNSDENWYPSSVMTRLICVPQCQLLCILYTYSKLLCIHRVKSWIDDTRRWRNSRKHTLVKDTQTLKMLLAVASDNNSYKYSNDIQCGDITDPPHNTYHTYL